MLLYYLINEEIANCSEIYLQKQKINDCVLPMMAQREHQLNSVPGLDMLPTFLLCEY